MTAEARRVEFEMQLHPVGFGRGIVGAVAGAIPREGRGPVLIVDWGAPPVEVLRVRVLKQGAESG